MLDSDPSSDQIKSTSLFTKKNTPTVNSISRSLSELSMVRNNASTHAETSQTKTFKPKQVSERQQVALLAAQKKTTDRLTGGDTIGGNTATGGSSNLFRYCCYAFYSYNAS